MLDIQKERDVKKYSKALIETAVHYNKIKEVNEEMLLLKDLFTKLFLDQTGENMYNSFGRRFLILNKKKQHQVLQDIMKDLNISSLCRNLALLLINSHKLGVFRYICLQWNELYSFYMGASGVKVVSAVALNTDEENSLKEKLLPYLGKNFYVEKVVDPKILGGLIIHINNKIYDDSLKTKISKITNIIKG